jgi:replication initiation protein RepC
MLAARRMAWRRKPARENFSLTRTKPAKHFNSTPGGYFHGMMAKAKSGELSLTRTIWGLRKQ